MIDYTTAVPLKEAVKSLAARTPLAKALSSKQWEKVPLAIRDRAFFISSVESERILVAAQTRILQRVKLEREKLADGGEGVTMDRGRFIQEMQEELEAIGYQPPEGKKGSIVDVSSAGRLGLIWDMQLAMAHGYATHLQGITPVGLDRAPWRELVRVEARHEPRDWPRIWAENGGRFYGEPSADYPEAPGRMIAHVLDKIWVRISRFGVPWPWYDWGSGMGQKVVRRRDGSDLRDGDGKPLPESPDPAPAAPPADDVKASTKTTSASSIPKDAAAVETVVQVPFNEGLQASTKGLPPASIERIRKDLGDAVKIEPENNVVRFQRDTSPANPLADLSISDELEMRRTILIDAAEKELAAVALESSLIERLAMVATGQLLAVIVPGLNALERLLALLLAWLPEQVKVVIENGVLKAWRPDLNGTPKEVAA